MNKPREWWIKQMGKESSGSQVWVCKSEPENHVNDNFIKTIHVIEGSAYEELQAKLAIAVEALTYMASKHEGLFMDSLFIDEARTALEKLK